jgi:hypothetical protein
MFPISCQYTSQGWFLPTRKTERQRSLSFHRTGSMSSSYAATSGFASRSAFNAHTLFLFSKSDMKTTVIPVVCHGNQRLYANGILTVDTVEPLRFGRCALVAHSSSFPCHTMRPVGLPSRTPVQFIKPTPRPGRR